MSPAIPVAASTPASFTFSLRKLSCNVQFRFYTDAAGSEGADYSPRGTGSRNLTATASTTSFEGSVQSPTTVFYQPFTSDIANGTFPAMPDGQWFELGLGSGAGQVTIVATPDVTPGGAVSYRVFVDADGASS